MTNRTFSINNEIKKELVEYKSELENIKKNDRNNDNKYSLQEERRQIRKGMHKIKGESNKYIVDGMKIKI
ncbi:hypothetical protein [Natronospora cellulosivora (SeqCode)]